MNRNYLLLCFLSYLACLLADTLAREAIVGGELSKNHQFPYQVSLTVHGNKTKCGGGIIGDHFILTAAHCVVRDDGIFYDDPITIMAGTNDLKKSDYPTVTRQVHKVYVPKEYDAKASSNPGDIAVLKLTHPLELSKHKHLKQLRLPNDEHEYYYGKIAMIAGFGWDWIKIERGHEFGGRSDLHLKFAEAVVLRPGHPNYFPLTIPKEHICARVKQPVRYKYRGVCVGDSGGPLVYNETVIGILIVGTCSEIRYGGMYARVSHHLKFIQNSIDNKWTKDSIRTHILHPL